MTKYFYTWFIFLKLLIQISAQIYVRISLYASYFQMSYKYLFFIGIFKAGKFPYIYLKLSKI